MLANAAGALQRLVERNIRRVVNPQVGRRKCGFATLRLLPPGNDPGLGLWGAAKKPGLPTSGTTALLSARCIFSFVAANCAIFTRR